jgi:hypothetical protein
LPRHPAAQRAHLGVLHGRVEARGEIGGHQVEFVRPHRARARDLDDPVALGDRVCLDYVSRPDAFARLYGKLLDGYLLDALERLDGKPADALRFVAVVDAAPTARRPSVGRGDDVRLQSDGVVGSGLELDGELVQLCAFSR